MKKWLDKYEAPKAQDGTILPRNLDPKYKAAIAEDKERLRQSQATVKSTKPFEVKDTRSLLSDSRAKERADAAWNAMQKGTALAAYFPHPLVSNSAVALNSGMGLIDAYYANQEGDTINRNINLVGAAPIPSYTVAKSLGEGLGNKFQSKANKFALMMLGLDAFGTAADLTNNFEFNKKQNGGAIEGTMGGLTDKGFNYNGAWGGPSIHHGGIFGKLTFLEPTSKKLPEGYNPKAEGSSTEYAISIGGEDGEPAYLIPSFKHGKYLTDEDAKAEFRRTGEHLGGPFKTYQEADEWERTVRHPYVEKGQSIPTPIKRWGNMQDGGDVAKAQFGDLVLIEKAQLGEYIPSWANPMNWGVEDYSKEKNFNKAYASAKKAGEEEFIYKGKRYNTKYAGTPRQEVGTYGIKGKPINKKFLNSPAQVNLYPSFGKYLPGHIAASVTNDPDAASVDYSPFGNNPFGLNQIDTKKGEKAYYVYGIDQDKFYNKAVSLPTGGYMLEDKYTPSDWNLFTNNCADNVCDAFGIPRDKGLNYPSEALYSIKEKYPTLDVTGRNDYDKYLSDIFKRTNYKGISNSQYNKLTHDKVKNNIDTFINVYYSPDTSSELKNKYGKHIQNFLKEEGYKLPKSTKGDGTLDGVLGEETNKALIDWKNKSLAMGGSIPGSVGFTYARTAGAAPANGPYAKKTKASAQNGKEMKFYQEGLDFKPKTISQDGSEIVKDDMGYWNPDNWGKPVEIDSNIITMEGVDVPLIGISDTGDVQYMEPGEEYVFDGETVTEYPVARNGINQADAQPIKKLDQSLNFTNYNKPTKGGWLNKYK